MFCWLYFIPALM